MAWEELMGIIAEAKDIVRQEQSTPPLECPNDYTALREGPNGELYCPWDGWRYSRDA